MTIKLEYQGKVTELTSLKCCECGVVADMIAPTGESQANAFCEKCYEKRIQPRPHVIMKRLSENSHLLFWSEKKGGWDSLNLAKVFMLDEQTKDQYHYNQNNYSPLREGKWMELPEYSQVEE